MIMSEAHCRNAQHNRDPTTVQVSGLAIKSDRVQTAFR